MAPIVLIGSDASLLEGIAQTLGHAGHRSRIAVSPAEAAPRPGEEPPLVLIVARALALGDRETRAALLRLPLAPGGAVVLYNPGGRPGDAEDAADEGPLPAPLRRATLAELTLPLERHRLVALVQSIEERAQRTGRGRRQTPPENRVV